MFATMCITANLALLIRVGIHDWHTRKIRNKDVAILLFLSVFYCLVLAPGEISSVPYSLLTATALLVPGWIFNIAGGGDVKLSWALAPLWPALDLLVIFSSGISLTIVLLILTRRAGEKPPALPLGTAMLLGTLCRLALSGVQHA